MAIIYNTKCVPKGCIPCLEKFNANLVYYVDSINNYIESGKFRKLFDFNFFKRKKNSSSSTQTDFNYIKVNCDGCEVTSPTNDWDIV